MKKLFISMLLFTLTMHSQTGLITYTEDYSNFSNPERGMYYFTSTNDSGLPNTYVPLDPLEIDGIIANNISLVLRIFRLDDFKNELNPNSNANFTTFKNNMIADFAVLRSKGVKCIVRFSYTNQEPTPQVPFVPDASKAVVLADIAALRTLTQNNSDVISSIEAGFIGTYGEWAYSGNFGNLGSLNATNIADRIEVGRAIVGLNITSGLTFTKKVAFRTPYYQQLIINSLPALSATTKSRIAAHNDCFLYDVNDNGTYISSPISLDQNFLETQSNLNFDGGETCRDAPDPLPLSDLYNMTNAKNNMQRYHFNYLNSSPYVQPGGRSPLTYWSTIPGADGNFLEEVKRKLGYRFVLRNSNIVNNVLTINIENVGFGNVFNARKVYLYFVGNSDPQNPGQGAKIVIEVELTNTDITQWKAQSTVTITKNLLGILPTGQWSVGIRIPDLNTNLASNSKYSIRFANTNNNGYGWNNNSGVNFFRTITVTPTSVSRLSENNLSIFEASTYPNPFNESFKLNINTSSEEKMNIKVFDMVGRLVDSMNTDTSKLAEQEVGNNYPAGVYTILISQGENTKTLRIIKR